MKKFWLLGLFILLLAYGLYTRFFFPWLSQAATLASVSATCSPLEASNKRMSCWEKNLVPIVQKAGVRPVLTQIEASFIASDEATSGGITKCHDITHAVGRVAGRMTTDLKESFSQCTSLCGYGCFMGVVDGYMTKGKNFMTEIDSVCSKTDQPLPCAHALGHAIGNRTGAIVDGLKDCDMVSDPERRQQCASGVFMELFETPNFTGHAVLPIPEDIAAFCDTLWGAYKDFCYTNIGNFSYVRDKDIDKSIALCSSLSQGYIAPCILSFAAEMYYRVNGVATDMNAVCERLDGESKSSCIEGALLKSVISDPVARHGFELCALQQGNVRSTCFATLGEMIEGNDTTGKNRKTLCEPLDLDDKTACLGT